MRWFGGMRLFGWFIIGGWSCGWVSDSLYSCYLLRQWTKSSVYPGYKHKQKLQQNSNRELHISFIYFHIIILTLVSKKKTAFDFRFQNLWRAQYMYTTSWIIFIRIIDGIELNWSLYFWISCLVIVVWPVLLTWIERLLLDIN